MRGPATGLRAVNHDGARAGAGDAAAALHNLIKDIPVVLRNALACGSRDSSHFEAPYLSVFSIYRAAVYHGPHTSPRAFGSLLLQIEVVKPDHVLTHDLPPLVLGDVGKIPGNDLLGMGPGRGSVWVIRRPQDVVDADLVTVLHTQRVIDE